MLLPVLLALGCRAQEAVHVSVCRGVEALPAGHEAADRDRCPAVAPQKGQGTRHQDGGQCAGEGDVGEIAPDVALG